MGYEERESEKPLPDPTGEDGGVAGEDLEFPGYEDLPLVVPDDGTISYGDPSEGDPSEGG